MNPDDPCSPLADARTIAAAVRRGEIGATEVVTCALARISAANDTLIAFSERLADAALSRARRIDSLTIRERRRRRLIGVPFAIKDNLPTETGRTTYGSLAFANNRAGFDAVIVARLLGEGAIPVGKTTLPEFGMGATTQSALYGTSRNPWDLSRTPGGSSGGSAASVAAGMVPIALGTDAGGSIRLPAACCGVLGLKPNRGRVPSAPVPREAWGGFSTPGPMARSVGDLACAFDIIAGAERGDPYVAPPLASSATEVVASNPSALRIGVVLEGPEAPVAVDCVGAVEAAASSLADAGHELRCVSPPMAGLRADFRVVALAGAAARELTVDQLTMIEPFSQAMRTAGDGISAAEYLRALERLRQAAVRILEIWTEVDVLVTPMTSTPPPPVATSAPTLERLDRDWDWAQFAYPFNVTGQPAISLPGRPSGSLPVGVQLVTAPGREDVLFAVAASLERSDPWPLVAPSYDPSGGKANQ